MDGLGSAVAGGLKPNRTASAAKQTISSKPSNFAWAVLILSLGLTFLAWHSSNNAIERGLHDRIDFAAADIGVAISKRIGDQERALQAGVGLFDASENVSRDEFREFVQTLQISENYPGLQGYGYAKVIKPGDKAAHIEEIRREGFADYTIKPAGKRSLYTSIVYLEPFDWRNKRAFGYDMFSQATRRAAMERARDTGLPSMTGAVTLVQETAKDTQRGFLLYLPVYESPEVPLTLAERRKAVRGFVYSPFRMNNLMQGVLGSAVQNARLKVFDGDALVEHNLLYDSHAQKTDSIVATDQKWIRVSTLQFGGRNWTLEITPDMRAFDSIARLQPVIMGIGGVVINLLVFILIVSISRRTARAHALADDMTKDLRRQMRRSSRILDNIGDCIVTTDADGRIASINPAGRRLFGYSSKVIDRLHISEVVPAAPKLFARCSGHCSEKDTPATTTKSTGVTKSGAEVPIEISATPLPGTDGKMCLWVLRDISEQTKIEKIQREFIAVVSHELRTPLTALAGSLGILNHGLTKEKTASLINLAHNNAKRLSLLVDDILDMEKFKSNEIDYHMREINLVPLMEDVVTEHADLAAQSNSKLRLDCRLTSAPVMADEHRLRQVLSNLISNALKFNRAGGLVTLFLHE